MGKTTVIPFDLEQAGSNQSSRFPSNVSLLSGGFSTKRKRKILKRKFWSFVSIRSIFIVLTVTMVLATALATYLTAQRSQDILIETLTDGDQQVGLALTVSKIQRLMDYLPSTRKLLYRFSVQSNFDQPSNRSYISGEYFELAEIMWTMAQQRENGAIHFIHWTTGKGYGVQITKGRGALLETMREPQTGYGVSTLYGYALKPEQLVKNVNRSEANTITKLPNFDPAEYIRLDPYAKVCGKVHNFADMNVFVVGGAPAYLTDQYVSYCDNNGEVQFLIYASVEVGSITSLLQQVGSDGVLTYIINEKKELVASSNGVPPFRFDVEKQIFIRNKAAEVSTNWISQTSRMITIGVSFYGDDVVIDGVPYFVSSSPFQSVETLNWTVVQLEPKDQFLEVLAVYRRTGVGILIGMVGLSICVVILATWWLTKPLILLSEELQKVSKLEMDLKHLSTPRFYEAKKLQSSFGQLHAAIRSFKKFVPSQVIVNILKYNREAVSHLSPANVTVMFQDIEGFTSLSETIEPMQLAALTEEYLEAMTGIISKHGGTVDKYIGDCIMSVFNVPENCENHQLEACKTAVECMQVLEKLNQSWSIKYKRTIKIRVGINTGDVLVGNMGSEHRMNYTVIGDNVNLAARLESVNKIYGTKIMISENLHNHLSHSNILSRKVSTVRVVGKVAETPIYQLTEVDSPTARLLFKEYSFALHYYENYQMNIALEAIARALQIDPQDVPSLRLRSRILDAPMMIPENWSFIETLEGK